MKDFLSSLSSTSIHSPENCESISVADLLIELDSRSIAQQASIVSATAEFVPSLPLSDTPSSACKDSTKAGVSSADSDSSATASLVCI